MQKNISQHLGVYAKSMGRPKIDRQLPGETMVEFEGKGKNTKIKKITPPMPRTEMPMPMRKKMMPAPKMKEKKIYKTYNV